MINSHDEWREKFVVKSSCSESCLLVTVMMIHVINSSSQQLWWNFLTASLSGGADKLQLREAVRIFFVCFAVSRPIVLSYVLLCQITLQDADQGWIYATYSCRASNELGSESRNVQLMRASKQYFVYEALFTNSPIWLNIKKENMCFASYCITR